MKSAIEAYLNPSTGSLIIQFLVLIIGTGFIFVRLYWNRLREWHKKKKLNKKNPPQNKDQKKS